MCEFFENRKTEIFCGLHIPDKFEDQNFLFSVFLFLHLCPDKTLFAHLH